MSRVPCRRLWFDKWESELQFFSNNQLSTFKNIRLRYFVSIVFGSVRVQGDNLSFVSSFFLSAPAINAFTVMWVWLAFIMTLQTRKTLRIVSHHQGECQLIHGHFRGFISACSRPWACRIAGRESPVGWSRSAAVASPFGSSSTRLCSLVHDATDREGPR